MDEPVKVEALWGGEWSLEATFASVEAAETWLADTHRRELYRIVGVEILDHVIVGDATSYFSFLDAGLLQPPKPEPEGGA